MSSSRLSRAALLALLLVAVALIPAMREPAPTRAQFLLFGSLASVEIRTAEAAVAEPALTELASLWNGFHRDWHPWEAGALTQLNQALAESRLSEPLPRSLLTLVRHGIDIERRSLGLVNPAIGALVSAWGFHTSEYPATAMPPSAATLSALTAARPSMRDLSIESDRVRSANPSVQLDFSAIAEGLALTEGAALLRRHGIRHALISIGGDVVALGRNRDRPWRVAIRDPGGGVLAELNLDDGEALFVAGGAQRFRVDDGIRKAHLIDPRSGRPEARALTAAVLHRDPLRADAAATALAIVGPDGAAALLASMEVRCALLLDAQGRLHRTAALAPRLRLRAPLAQAVLDVGRGGDSDCR